MKTWTLDREGDGQRRGMRERGSRKIEIRENKYKRRDEREE